MPREKELKFALTPEEAERLTAELEKLYSEPEVLRQKNTYLDDRAGSLAEKKMSLRVREENGRFFLCCKVGKNADNGYFQFEEDEIRIPAEKAREFIQNGIELPSDEFQPLGIASKIVGTKCRVRALGGPDNLRKVFKAKAYKLELDKTDFGRDVIDYELEVETDDPGRAAADVRELFDRLGIETRLQKTTKKERFSNLVKQRKKS